MPCSNPRLMCSFLIAAEPKRMWKVRVVLPPLFLEQHGHDHSLGARRLERVVVDDLPVRHDLQVGAAERCVLFAARSRHGEAVASADAEIDLAQRDRPALGSEPLTHVLRLAARLEQHAGKHVIDAGEGEVAIVRRVSDVCLSAQLPSPCDAGSAPGCRAGPAAPPRGGDTRRSTPPPAPAPPR